MSAPDSAPVVHGDERTPPTRPEDAPLADRLVLAAAAALNGGEERHALQRWGYDARTTAVAVLRGIEAVLSDWTDEDYAASDALDLVADAADEIEGSVSGGGNTAEGSTP